MVIAKFRKPLISLSRGIFISLRLDFRVGEQNMEK